MKYLGLLQDQTTLERVKKLMIMTIIVLFAAIGVSVLELDHTFNRERDVVNQQIDFRNLGIEFATASDYLTAQARNYVQFGDKTYMNNYWQEVNEKRTRDQVLMQLRQMRPPANELRLMEKAKSYSDALILTEDTAMKAAQEGNFQLGRELMFDSSYNDKKMLIMGSVAEYQRDMDIRMAQEKQVIIQEEDNWILLINALIFFAFTVIYGLLFLRGKQIDEESWKFG